MDMDKKYIAIFILSIALVASSIGNVYLSFDTTFSYSAPISRTFVVGTREGPNDLDPINSWDRASNDVIEQVCEGLYMHNLSDPNLGIVPQLALDYGSWDVSATHFTVQLRQGVLFHDGTKFNASSVVWTFERINYFINASGMPLILNETISKIHSLYEFPNGTSILDPVNPVTVNSEYSVTINLRGPYAIFEPLICYVTAFMLSPESTPKYEYIHTLYGKIVGTGPFVYDYYLADTEVKLHRWDNYWRLPAFFEDLIISIISDSTTIYNAIKSHTVDYLIGGPPAFISADYSDPTLTLRSGIPSLSYYYLGMNNERINKTWRQAISYGINYTYITEELQDGTVYRSNGPLAPNFPMYDSTIQAATYNLTKAREVVVSMGFGNMDWTDAQWIAANFAAWNYSYNIGNSFREDLLILLTYNLDLIGINVIDTGMSWAEFINTAYGYWGGYDSLEFFWIGRGPSYLSPFNMIAPLFSNKSAFNAAQYHNHDAEMWLDQVLTETDAATRQALYTNILHQIVEVDMPHAFGYHPYGARVHSADIKGVPYNAMGTFYAYPMYRDSTFS